MTKSESVESVITRRPPSSVLNCPVRSENPLSTSSPTPVVTRTLPEILSAALSVDVFAKTTLPLRSTGRAWLSPWKRVVCMDQRLPTASKSPPTTTASVKGPTACAVVPSSTTLPLNFTPAPSIERIVPSVTCNDPMTFHEASAMLRVGFVPLKRRRWPDCAAKVEKPEPICAKSPRTSSTPAKSEMLSSVPAKVAPATESESLASVMRSRPAPCVCRLSPMRASGPTISRTPVTVTEPGWLNPNVCEPATRVGIVPTAASSVPPLPKAMSESARKRAPT